MEPLRQLQYLSLVSKVTTGELLSRCWEQLGFTACTTTLWCVQSWRTT